MAFRPFRPNSTMAQLRAWKGPAIFSYGFRPFFLFGGLYAALCLALFVPWQFGFYVLAPGISPADWHAHAMLFGYLPAAVSGFLLTAVPNWTGRLPVVGWPLAGLFALWLAGRIAWIAQGWTGLLAASLIDTLYLPVLFAFLAREVFLGKNWKNIKVLVLVGLMTAANMLFHDRLLNGMPTVFPERFGIAVGIGLIMLIGGRVIPSFTTNWMRSRGIPNLPAPFDLFDFATVAFSSAALALWVLGILVYVPSVFLTAALGLAAVLNMVRVGRWRGQYTLDEPLVAVLHAGFAFIPLGFALAASAVWRHDALLMTGAIHAWTAGAIGLMTIAIMTRATRGHAGHELTAGFETVMIYGLVGIAAVARVGAALWPAQNFALVSVAGLFWFVGFAMFVVFYGPMLLSARRSE